MKHSKYQQEIGATASCTNTMMEETKVIGRKYINGSTNDCFVFYSLFSSKKAVESAMEFVPILLVR